MIRFDVRHAIYALLITVGVVAPLLFLALQHRMLFFGERLFQDTILLNRIEMLQEDVQDRLYRVTARTTGEQFLVAADGEIAESEMYAVEELHRNSFWNPVSCSRVPFVKQGGALYFLEVARVPEGDSFREDYQMRVFDVSKKELTRFSLGVHTVGFIYHDEEGVYIATGIIEGAVPTILAMYGFDNRGARMHLRDVFDVQSYGMTSPIFRRSEGRFVLSFYDRAVQSRDLIYRGGRLQDVATATKDEAIYFEGDAFKVFDVRASAYLRKQSLVDFSHVQIVERNTARVVVDFKPDGIHKYVLTEI